MVGSDVNDGVTENLTGKNNIKWSTTMLSFQNAYHIERSQKAVRRRKIAIDDFARENMPWRDRPQADLKS